MCWGLVSIGYVQFNKTIKYINLKKNVLCKYILTKIYKLKYKI